MPDEVARCRYFLEGQLEIVEPRVVLTLGNFAMRAMRSTNEGITACHGRRYVVGVFTLVSTFHPAAALRGGESVLQAMRADFRVVKDVLEARTT
jgi:DNA polymerase